MNELETLLNLVKCYSPSGQERQAVEYLVARMEYLGYTQAFVDEAGNAIGIMGNGPRQIVLLGHIDTVPGRIPVRIEGDALYGRGSVDAKGPLACFTDAVAQLGERPDRQFVVIGAVEEERDSDGARYVAAHYHPHYAIIGEPNRWDRIALGYKGSAWAEITFQRAQAHTAAGEENACEMAVQAWQAIHRWAEAFNVGRARAFDRLLVSLRGMTSGDEDYRQWARLNVNARLPLDLPPPAWYEALREILKAFPASDTVLTPSGYALPACECAKNSPLVRAFLAAIRAAGGQPSFVYKTGTADLNVVAPAWSCPALVYGPGDSTLDHTPNEHISLKEYRKAVNVLKDALQRL